MMLKSLRWVSLSVWVALLAIAFLTSPDADPRTNERIGHLLQGQLDGVNLSFFALFCLMGVWPMIFAAMLAFDSRDTKVWRWPFVLGAFALGAFALMPYLVLRRWGAPRETQNVFWLRSLGSRWFALLCTALAALFTLLFFAGGDLAGFPALFRDDQFTYVMSFDFIACTLAGVLLSLEDAAVRAHAPSWRWALGSIIGVALRLVRAPSAP